MLASKTELQDFLMIKLNLGYFIGLMLDIFVTGPQHIVISQSPGEHLADWFVFDGLLSVTKVASSINLFDILNKRIENWTLNLWRGIFSEPKLS
jgi:hypothetical protein